MKLGLNSAWAVFTSMGISPAARDGAAVAAGGSLTLKGRLYPALADGARVYLHAYYGGSWHSAGSRHPARQPRACRARTRRATPRTAISVAPATTTKYYFSSGKAKSPVTTIKVD